MGNYYIMLPKNSTNTNRGYVPSYSRGFVTASSLFFHRSGQIWELLGLPKDCTIKAEMTSEAKTYTLHKVGNFTEREKSLTFSSVWALEFGPKGKVTASTCESKEPPIQLKWRRCSIAEIRLREVIGSI